MESRSRKERIITIIRIAIIIPIPTWIILSDNPDAKNGRIWNNLEKIHKK